MFNYDVTATGTTSGTPNASKSTMLIMKINLLKRIKVFLQSI